MDETIQRKYPPEIHTLTTGNRLRIAKISATFSRAIRGHQPLVLVRVPDLKLGGLFQSG